MQAAQVEQADRVAEELLAHLMACRPLEIYLQPTPPTAMQLEPLVQRLESGEPLQYVMGYTDFRELCIQCDTRALIPRPETELLVEEVLQAPWSTPHPDIIEVGTGSGCIICSLAFELPQGRYTAVDLSPDALALAQENAAINRLNIIFKRQSLLDGEQEASFDAITANLPYISTSDWQMLDPSVRNYEPRMALDSGPSGLELIEQLVAQSRTVLRPAGLLFLEFGFDQGQPVANLLRKAGFEQIRIKQDLAGLDRMAIAQNPC